jgi:hypothetical protein
MSSSFSEFLLETAKMYDLNEEIIITEIFFYMDKKDICNILEIASVSVFKLIETLPAFRAFWINLFFITMY